MSTKHSTTCCDYLEYDSTLNRSLKILKNERDYKIAFLIIVGINFGLRIGDLKRLKFEDMLSNPLKVTESKTKKTRIIQLNETVLKAFDIFIGRSKVKEGYMFLSNQKKIFSTQYINRTLKKYFGKANLNISSHSLRKTFGRRVWNNNQNTDLALVLLSEIFDHSTVSETRKYLGLRSEEIANIYLNL